MTTINNSTITAKRTLTALAAGIIPGMKKHFPNGSQPLSLGGGGLTTTVDAVVTDLQTLVDNRAAVTSAKAAATVAVATENAKIATLLTLLRELEAFLRFNFGANATTMADFGLKPHKARTPMTAEQKAVAQAKAKATREARGTKGPKAKKAIKGNVSATLVVTPATPAVPAVAPAAPAATPVATTPAVKA